MAAIVIFDRASRFGHRDGAASGQLQSAVNLIGLPEHRVRAGRSGDGRKR
jgi:hypothetical protein